MDLVWTMLRCRPHRAARPSTGRKGAVVARRWGVACRAYPYCRVVAAPGCCHTGSWLQPDELEAATLLT